MLADQTVDDRDHAGQREPERTPDTVAARTSRRLLVVRRLGYVHGWMGGALNGSDPGYESPRDRKRLARQAGLGRLSFISAFAGVLVAYGAFALLAALVGAVAVALGLATELASNDWTTLGRGSAVAVTVVAFVAYLFGGLWPGGWPAGPGWSTA